MTKYYIQTLILGTLLGFLDFKPRLEGFLKVGHMGHFDFGFWILDFGFTPP